MNSVSNSLPVANVEIRPNHILLEDEDWSSLGVPYAPMPGRLLRKPDCCPSLSGGLMGDIDSVSSVQSTFFRFEMTIKPFPIVRLGRATDPGALLRSSVSSLAGKETVSRNPGWGMLRSSLRSSSRLIAAFLAANACFATSPS